MWTRSKPTIKRDASRCFLLIALIASGCTHDEREPLAPFVVGANDVREGSERTTDGSAQTDSREAEAPCTPRCEPGQCDEDGCGGSCGPCSILTPFCYAGWCQLDPPPKEPTLELDPPLVDFGTVALGDVAERTITLRSMGKEALEISRFGISGDGAFVVMQDEQPWRSPSGSEIVVELLEPWRLEAGESRTLSLRYAPVDEQPGEAMLRLVSNDPNAPSGHIILLRGGPPVVCAEWSEASLDFGATIFGTQSVKTLRLINCGTISVEIDAITLTGDNAGAFSFEGAPPTTLTPGDTWETEVSYEPTPGSVGALGALEATLSWESGEVVASVDLTGFVVVEDCPVAVAMIAEEGPVAPGTVLHLSGVESYSPVAQVSTYTWSVDEPLGSVGRFAPDAESPTTTFGAMVAGKYRFDLSVSDSTGKAACIPSSQTIRVAPESALYIELTWETPGDPDPSDQGLSVGTDLDLHLAHPEASGSDLDEDGSPEPWFDPLYDCYWFNPSPDWGPFHPPTDDDPHLTIEDIDGAGPEAIALDLPETDVTYRVAVHAWQDHGFGVSIATLRVYLLGDQIFQSQPIPLMQHDLWEVAEITWHGWPEATVTPLAASNGGPRIFSGAQP